MIDNNINDDIETVETGLKPVSTKIHISKTKKQTKTHGLFEFVRALKTFSSRKINKINNTKGRSIWQLRFYDHVIRNDKDLNRIRDYIKSNPLNWNNDEDNIYRNK